MALIETIDVAKYFSLTTYRRDGRAVPTPVWFARVGNHWYVFSAGNAGKVKRLRHTEAVTVAACDMRGKVSSEALTTSASLVLAPPDDTEANGAYDALLARYGWFMRLANWGATLTGRIHTRQLIRVVIPT